MRGILVRTLDQAELVKGGSFLSGIRIRKMDFALAALLLFLLVTSTFVFHVWSRLYVFRLGYEIYQQDKVSRELLEESRRLNLEIASLKSPSRLEAIARQELNLRPPRADQVVMVPVEKSPTLALASVEDPARE